MSTDLLRQEIAATAHLVVVKVGTRVLTADDGTISRPRIEKLVEDLMKLRAAGKQVVLVSSGAVGAGMAALGLKSRPTDLAKLQAVAAVGQANLMQVYDQYLQTHGCRAAQVLLTAEDVEHRTRYLNVRNTINSALEFDTLPIINENDTVAVDELATTFGDNDRLAAVVTNLLRAPLLVILSDVEGLFDGDPAVAGSQRISTVRKIDETILSYVRDKKTGLSKGGMASKLEAARLCTTAGENVIIAPGRRNGVLAEINAGQDVGTLFIAQGKRFSPRKRWIGLTVQPAGKLHLDDGAVKAIVSAGKSLLAIGIQKVEGNFEKGDVLAIHGPTGREIARGLSNYSAADLHRIRGLTSEEIAHVLGASAYKVVIHRDNLAVVETS